jgi:tetratricopeptide (TPR) repeat protein
MRKPKAIIILAGLTLLFLTGILAADDTNINVNIEPKGSSGKTINLQNQDLKTQEYLKDKEKAERKKQAEEFCDLADMYYSKGEPGMAAEYYQKAITANESNKRAHEGLLKVQRELDDVSAMSGEHYSKAMHYLGSGYTDKAIDELVLELKENPDNEAARVKLNELEARRSPK